MYFHYGWWASTKDRWFIILLNYDFLCRNLVQWSIKVSKQISPKRSLKWVTGGIRLFQH